MAWRLNALLFLATAEQYSTQNYVHSFHNLLYTQNARINIQLISTPSGKAYYLQHIMSDLFEISQQRMFSAFSDT